MRAVRADLTDEEWEMLGRLNRGAPESRMIPATILQRFVELRLAAIRAGQPRITDLGKALILRDKDQAPSRPTNGTT